MEETNESGRIKGRTSCEDRYGKMARAREGQKNERNRERERERERERCSGSGRKWPVGRLEPPWLPLY